MTQYYLVTEAELLELKSAATIVSCGYCYSDERKEVDVALAACMARPVAEITRPMEIDDV